MTRPVPYGRIYYRLAEAFGWGPDVVGELTLDQVLLYTTEGTGATTVTLSPAEAAAHFVAVKGG